jgi:hypothetical protein
VFADDLEHGLKVARVLHLLHGEGFERRQNVLRASTGSDNKERLNIK